MWIWDDEKFGDLAKLGKKNLCRVRERHTDIKFHQFLHQYRIRELLFGEKKAIQEIDDRNSGLYNVGMNEIFKRY